jgi:hypothetical protein
MRELIEARQAMPDQTALPEMVSNFDSSNVHSFGYNEASENLFIRFWKDSKSKKSQVPGPVYKYFKVPKRVFDMMYFAKSKGEFVWFHIRDRYRYKMIGRAGWRMKAPVRKKARGRAKVPAAVRSRQ